MRQFPTSKAILFRLLAATAILLLTFAGSVCAQGTPAPANQAAVAAATDPRAELARALAWPIAAIVVAFLLYAPFKLFVVAIGGRITKLSLPKILEIELPPAKAAAPLLLDDLRAATTGAKIRGIEIRDSSRAVLEQVQSTEPADYALIALGQGDKWLTSRLFISAIMMQRMRGVQVFVFVESTATSDQRLVAVAPVGQLRWALAQRYPWLELAWVRANMSALASPVSTTQLAPGQQLGAEACWLPDPRAQSMSLPLVVASDTGAFAPSTARQIAQDFIQSLQQPSCPTQEPWQWQKLPDGGYERARWVTRRLLTSLLPQEARDAWVNDLRDAPRSQRTRAILRRCQTDFVALTVGEREFSVPKPTQAYEPEVPVERTRQSLRRARKSGRTRGRATGLRAWLVPLHSEFDQSPRLSPVVMAGHRAGHPSPHAAATDARDKPGQARP
jgi:hypothetical protein